MRSHSPLNATISSVSVLKITAERTESLFVGSQVLNVFVKKTFLLCICILNIARGVFNIKSPLFFNLHPLFTCIYHYKRTFFWGLLKKWNQKNVLGNKVSKCQDYISRDFLFLGLIFHRTFQLQNLGLNFRNCFWRLPRNRNKTKLPRMYF